MPAASTGIVRRGEDLVDDVIPAVDIKRFACDQLGAVHREECDGHTDVIDGDEAAGRRL